MRKRLKKAIALALLPILSSTLNAEPSLFVKSLMSEPASMWDLGMMRLKMHINMAFGGKAKVIYFWEKNVIYIELHAEGIADTKVEGRELCESQLKKLRSHFFFSTKMMNKGDRLSSYRTVGSHANLYSIFNHEFYETNKKRFDMEKEIQNIIVLRGVTSVISAEEKSTYILSCDGSVNGSEVTFEELRL